jgi:hypothetical protein
MSDFPMPPDGWEDAPPGLGDLTGGERDLLAHLAVLVIQQGLVKTKPWARDYAVVAGALGELAADGQVELIGDDQDVWVVIRGRVITHAARDWLRWTALQAERSAARN